MRTPGRTLVLGATALLVGCVDPSKFKNDAVGAGGGGDARVAAVDAAPPAGDTAPIPPPDAATPDAEAALDAAPAPDAAPDAAPVKDAGPDGAIPVDATGPDANPPPMDAAPALPCQVHFIVQLPGDTPAGDDIYVAGNAWDWDPRSAALRMTRAGDQAELTAPLDPGAQLEYKYTRGDWPQVERNADCGERADRGAFIQCDPGGEQTLRDAVERWADVHCGG